MSRIFVHIPPCQSPESEYVSYAESASGAFLFEPIETLRDVRSILYPTWETQTMSIVKDSTANKIYVDFVDNSRLEFRL